VERSLQNLVDAGTLTKDEVKILMPLPSKAGVVVSWLALTWEKLFDASNGLAASAVFPRNPTINNGRYGVVFGSICKARDAIGLCHMYMQTQLPYGYIHLILTVVHITCLANSIFCGIHLGQTMREAMDTHDEAPVWIPLIFVRIMRICFIPLLLDGMLLIGTVIAMPLGSDDDDFPCGAFLEHLEDDLLSPGAANEILTPILPVMRFTKAGEKKEE